jgi:hypothetical protein
MFNLFGCNNSVTGIAQSVCSPVMAYRLQPAILYGSQQGTVNEKVSDRTLVLEKLTLANPASSIRGQSSGDTRHDGKSLFMIC